MITVKFYEENEDPELFRFLKEGEGDFEIPRYFPIPKGERSTTHRVKILMLAGLEALKEKYPKKNKNKDVKETIKEELKEKSEPQLAEGWV